MNDKELDELFEKHIKWSYSNGKQGSADEMHYYQLKDLDDLKSSIKSRDQQIALEARIDELEPFSLHADNQCESIKAFHSQQAWHEDSSGKRTYIGKDRIDCFDYLCTCGALKIIDRLATLKSKQKGTTNDK